MKKLYEYLDYEMIRAVLSDRRAYEGRPISVFYADENESGEDELAIETPSRIVGIRESEIARIEILKE